MSSSPPRPIPRRKGRSRIPTGACSGCVPRSAIPRGPGGQPGTGVRALWQVIADVARGVGHDPGEFRTGFQVSTKLLAAVPFYNGITLEEIGGRGVRWPERADYENPAWEPAKLEAPAALPAPSDGKVRLGTYRPLWAAKEVDLSPALHFIRAKQVAELSPVDAAALGIGDGDHVSVGNGTRVNAVVRLRDAVPAGSLFLAEGTSENNVERAHRRLAGRRRARRAGLRPRRRRSPPRCSPPSRAWPRCRRPRPLPIPPREVT